MDRIFIIIIIINKHSDSVGLNSLADVRMTESHVKLKAKKGKSLFLHAYP